MFTKEAAAQFSWHGQKGNIEIRTFLIMNILRGKLKKSNKHVN